MASVRQAHLPGNCELYDSASIKLSGVLCKMCWEEEQLMKVDSLDTVWVSSSGWLMIWWLCRNHEDEIRTRGPEETRFLKSVRGVTRAPELRMES